MNAHFGKSRTKPSAQSFIGLLIAVIWTAMALPPCLMASVPASMPAHVNHHANHTDAVRHSATEAANPGCAHCLSTRDSPAPCSDALPGACAIDDQTPWLTQTKPLDTEKFYRLPKPPAFAQGPRVVAHQPELVEPRHDYTAPGVAGPALFDLFRTYLK